MDPYDINLAGEALTIHPQEDGTYLVIKGYERVMHLYPDVTNMGVTWHTADLIPMEYMKQVGELIEEHEL